MVYDPSGMRGHARKHACPDCYFCQSCSEVRCRSCRASKGGAAEKPLSLRDQVLLFERVNGEGRNSEERKPLIEQWAVR